MSQNVIVSDPLAFARDAASLSGEFGSAELPRLAASSLELGAVRWHVSGLRLEDGRAALQRSHAAFHVVVKDGQVGGIDAHNGRVVDQFAHAQLRAAGEPIARHGRLDARDGGDFTDGRGRQ